MDDAISMRGLRIADPDEVDWLRELEPAASISFMPHAWPAETWVLHGIWEDPEHGPADSLDPELRERTGLFCSEVTGFASPPPGWRRVRWHELADRLGVPMCGSSRGKPVPPCHHWFPYSSWPATMIQPNEGSLDAPTGNRLISVLAEVTEGGLDAPCIAYYSGAGWPFGEWSQLTLSGPLVSVLDAARFSTRDTVTPDNIWPIDRNWLLTTDYDLWGTRIAGSPEVVHAVETDPKLESVRHPPDVTAS
ncbi:hypothetical protein [Actinomycetospora sp. TBRC 11914]|uniref:hypothetical protein n=1 Tax=Actinomycetospora sp. TBRC 11914 TaxID=2729387 RepID=UPI00145D3DD5|nr:hypothetical protein [Actinomycetospora sp. TBRC 11914]NMO93215.1 hypothetical protein [Actinomycetospora sp. TBRC 11914]